MSAETKKVVVMVVVERWPLGARCIRKLMNMCILFWYRIEFCGVSLLVIGSLICNFLYLFLVKILQRYSQMILFSNGATASPLYILSPRAHVLRYVTLR